jgi:DNA-binding MarR family transcriptional regulator
MTRDALLELDTALLGLRRFLSPQQARPPFTHHGVAVEFSTMLVVDAVARSPEATLSVGEVAEALQVAPSTASRLVERAVAAGMVIRENDADPRRCALHLSAAGRRLHRAALAHRTALLAAATHDWHSDEVEQLASLLSRFTHAIHPDPTTPRSIP